MEDPYADENNEDSTVLQEISSNLEQVYISTGDPPPQGSSFLICEEFMFNRCHDEHCIKAHDKQLCFYFWKNGSCKYGSECRKKHITTVGRRNLIENRGSTLTPPSIKINNEDKRMLSKRVKNTECFEPMTAPVDMRIVFDLGSYPGKFQRKLTTRDVVLIPNVFNDFQPGEIYHRLESEIRHCGIPKDRLLKLWHGNDKIEGTHLIADDKTRWKDNCPTFTMIIQRLQSFFEMDIKATRFNWYSDTSQWKPFHHDAAAVKPDKAKTQNFTVAVSFGACRDAAFEHAKTKAVISMPQPDGCIYAFTNDTNVIWRHGILQDVPVRQEGRISVIAWGWVEGLL